MEEKKEIINNEGKVEINKLQRILMIRRIFKEIKH